MSSFSMNAASSYGPRTMTVTCSQTTNGSSANTSTINWTLSTQGSNSSASLFDTGPTSLDIAGVNRYWKERVTWSANKFPAAAGSTSGSFTLSHKDDGTIDPITVSLSTAIYWGEVKTASKQWTLDKIDRYFSSTPSIAFSSKTETSISYTWSTSETCKKVVVHYKKSSESSYTNTTVYDNSSGTKSGSFTLSSLAANTTYNVYITATRKDSSMPSDSGVNNTATYNYPYISGISTTALTIGNEQTITISNPMSRSVTVKMYKTSTSGTVLYTSAATTGTSVKIKTADIASTLYASIPNDTSAYCVYSVICSSPSYTWTTTSNTYSYQIKGDEKPTFDVANLLTYDATTAVTNITKQTAAGGWLTQALSELKVVVNAAGSAKNSASISKYEVTFAGVTKTLSVNSTGGTWPTFNGSGTQTVSIKVTDSRGLNNTYTKNVVYKPYQAPSIALTGGRENNYGETVNLVTTYTSSSVESTNKITVTWSGAGQSGTLVSAGTAGNGSVNKTVTNVDNNTAYTFKATIQDSFGKSAEASLPVSIGMPMMFIDDEQLGVGINMFPQGQGLWVDGQANIDGNTNVNGDFVVTNGNIELDGDHLKAKTEWGRSTYIATDEGLLRTKIDLRNYDVNTYYPVVASIGNARGYTRVKVAVQLDSGSKPSWSTHSQGFTANLDILMKPCGWGTTNGTSILLDYAYGFADKHPLGVSQMTNSSRIVLWMRGGGIYPIYSDAVAEWTLITKSTTYSEQSVAPQASNPGVNVSLSRIYAKTDPLDAYPVGSVYVSTDSTSPASKFGGTWTQISGRFLYCTTTSKTTGGASSVSYTPAGTNVGWAVTVAQLPAHCHGQNSRTGDGNWNGEVKTTGGSSGGSWPAQAGWTNNGDSWGSGITAYTGSGNTHTHTVNGTAATISTMPPWFSVYAWYRTA